MISFNYETDFELENYKRISDWISQLILEEDRKEGDINYIFCNDDYLHELNVEYLSHDTLTDVISFDYSVGKRLHGEIYISVDRVRENAIDFNEEFIWEMLRVMAHGVLHYCGYKDKAPEDIKEMRSKEDYYLDKLRA